MADGFITAAPAATRTALLLAYPGVTAVELFAVQYFLAGIPGMVPSVVARSLEPVTGDLGAVVLPAFNFATAPLACDVLVVPGGGPGTVAAMKDPDVLGFLRSRGAQAGIVTGLCTGVLVLGAAGLLRGRRATSHWLVRDALLPRLGATPVAARIVEDGPRLITASGVSAGLDLGLALVRRFMGDAYAAKLELLAELHSAPEPGENPAAGTLREMFAPLLSQAEAAADSARATWPLSETVALVQPEPIRG
jgi:transcriptional regulator GlxA family with amidase domain